MHCVCCMLDRGPTFIPDDGAPNWECRPPRGNWPARDAASVTSGETPPSDGNAQDIVQTSNFLPSGFEEGIVAYARAQSVQRWVQAE